MMSAMFLNIVSALLTGSFLILTCLKAVVKS